MTVVIVVTVGSPPSKRRLDTNLREIASMSDVHLSGISLWAAPELEAAGVEYLQLDQRPPSSKRVPRPRQLLRHATLRSARWQLWRAIAGNGEALARLSTADIVLVDGPISIYTGWRISRRFAEPWVILDGHGVKNLLLNR